MSRVLLQFKKRNPFKDLESGLKTSPSNTNYEFFQEERERERLFFHRHAHKYESNHRVLFLETHPSRGMGGRQHVIRQHDGFRTRPLKLITTAPGPPTHARHNDMKL